MISIKGCVLASVVCVALIQPLDAQEDNTAAERVAPIAQQLASWHSILSAKKSLSAVAVGTCHVEPGLGQDASPDSAVTFKLFYKGNRFLYDVDWVGAKGPTYSQVNSFDGERYSLLNRVGGMLSISSKGFHHVVMCKWHVLFMPFQFLQSGFRVNPFAQLSYDHLTNKDDWRNTLTSLPSTSSAEDVVLEGLQYLKVTKIGKHIDPSTDAECVYDVYFAKSFNWYPMKWERRLLSTGDIITFYSVEELDSIMTETGESIPYPKRSVSKTYRASKLRDTVRLEVIDISFDSVSDDDLSIDPASASRIRDLDNNVRFQVPK